MSLYQDVMAFQLDQNVHPLTCRYCRGTTGSCPRSDVMVVNGDHHVLVPIDDSWVIDLYCSCCQRNQPLDRDVAKMIQFHVDPIVSSPSGWSYRQSQENGDQVDCIECGTQLSDDLPIENDSNGYAGHPDCFLWVK